LNDHSYISSYKKYTIKRGIITLPLCPCCEFACLCYARIVDFGDTLTAILKKARKEQLKNQMQYGQLYHTNYYKGGKSELRKALG
jgi:hypothetical protein